MKTCVIAFILSACAVFSRAALAEEAATTITVTSITATPSTNFNGSTVCLTYANYAHAGEGTVTFNLTVGSTTYAGTRDETAKTITFVVPTSAVTAGTTTPATLTIADSAMTDPVYANTVWLCQGAQGDATASQQFLTSGTQLETSGTWAAKPSVDTNNKIVITDEDDETFTFTPISASSTQCAVFDMAFSSEAALDALPSSAASLQGAYRIITDDLTAATPSYHFSLYVNGAWVTNTTYAATLDTDYDMRVTFNYRTIPATIVYAVKTSSEANYTTLAEGTIAHAADHLSSFACSGNGLLTVATGTNVAYAADAALAQSGDDKYATVDAAIADGKNDVTLLWNTAWQPKSGTGALTLRKGAYNWYYTPEEGLVATNLTAGGIAIVTDYFEAMNLVANGETTTTNKFTFLTNALERSATAEYDNLHLLRDVALPANDDVAIPATLALHGETYALTGKGFTVNDGVTLTIPNGYIGITEIGGAGAKELTGGYYTSATTLATLPSGYSLVALANANRAGYGYHVMPDSAKPGDGETLLAVKDANGQDAGAIVLNAEWVATKTGESEAAAQAAVLNTKQSNNLTKWENDVLGLNGNNADAKPVISSAASTTSGKLLLGLGGVKVDAASGAHVTYRIFTSTKPGGKDGTVTQATAPGTPTEITLPTTGVRYYTIEVNATTK